jgi:hypothetical protein
MSFYANTKLPTYALIYLPKVINVNVLCFLNKHQPMTLLSSSGRGYKQPTYVVYIGDVLPNLT